MVIYGLKQNFVIRPSPFKGNEKGLDKKNPTKFSFRSILGCMLNSYNKCIFYSPNARRTISACCSSCTFLKPEAGEALDLRAT